MTEVSSGPEIGPPKVDTAMQTVFSLLARVFLGFLFLVAGLPKIEDTDSFAISILNYELLPPSLVPAMAGYLPWLEVIVGLALLLGLFTRAGAAGAALLSTTFALSITSAIVRDLDIDCGCFAVESQADWPHVLLNVVALLLALYLMVRGEGKFTIDKAFSLTEKTLKHWNLLLALSLLLLAVNLAFGWGITSTSEAPAEPAITTPFPIATKTPESSPPRSAPEVSTLPEQSGPGTLTFDPPMLDLGGGIMQGETMSAEATYTNTGGRPLTILEVAKTCGCTDVKISHKVLKPGEQGTLTVEFEADDTTGELFRGLVFTIKDQPETVTYVLRVEVEPILTLNPGQLSLKPGETQKVSLEQRQEGFEFQVLELDSSDPRIVVDNLQQIEPGMVTFDVTLQESIESKESDGSFSIVQVHTDLSNVPVLRLLVNEAKS